MHYQQFDYSTSGTDDQLSDIMLPVPPDLINAGQAEPETPPAASDQSISPARILPQLFSDHERVRSPSPQISSSDKDSLPGTSASLLTNPSLTNFLSNYPIWPTAPPIPLKSASDESDVQPELPNIPTASPGAGIAPSFKRGRGRPPKAQKKQLVRAKAKTRKKESTIETEALAETATQAETEKLKSAEASEASRYQLRSRRQPRYKCGTCGLRDCVCLLAVKENRKVPIGARRVPPEEREKLVHRLTVRAEKTYSAVERSGNHPVDVILGKLSLPGVEKAPCPRFKEWTSDEKGLEFNLPTVMPPVPNNIAFGPFNFEREPVQMARCITADLLCDKYGVQVEPGGVYSPAPHWWLLVTAPRVETIVEPLHLLSCLESLRTLTTTDLILCFHIVDWYRGFGPRETYLLVGQSIPCLGEHVRGYWYSCGFTQPRVCVNIKHRAEIALSFRSTPFSPLPLPDCNIPGRVLNTLATQILTCYVTPSNIFVLVKLVRFEFVTVPLRSRCCITVTG